MLLPGDFGRTLLRPGLLLQLQLPLANVRHGPDGRRVEEGLPGRRLERLQAGAIESQRLAKGFALEIPTAYGASLNMLRPRNC